MANLVFLEAAIQSEGAATIIESNEALINFATAEVDSLIKLEYSKSNKFITATLECTSLHISNSISSIVIESSSIFSSIIASDNHSNSEKKELIEAYSYAIGCDDPELKVILCFGAGSMALSMAGGMAGSKIGNKVGSAVGALASRLSGSHKQWKMKIKEVEQVKEQLRRNPNPALKKKLAHLEKEKTQEHIKYLAVKEKSQSIAATAVGTVGGMAGSIGARVVGAAHGVA